MLPRLPTWEGDLRDEICTGSSPLRSLVDGQSYFVFSLCMGKMSSGIDTLIKSSILGERRQGIEKLSV